MSFLDKIVHRGGLQLMILKPGCGLQDTCIINSELRQWKHRVLLEGPCHFALSLFEGTLWQQRGVCVCALATPNCYPGWWVQIVNENKFILKKLRSVPSLLPYGQPTAAEWWENKCLKTPKKALSERFSGHLKWKINCG